MGQLLGLICCKVNVLVEAKLCGIPHWWMRHSVSPWVVVLAQHLGLGKQIYTQEKFMPRSMKCCSFYDGSVLCNLSATRVLWSPWGVVS